MPSVSAISVDGQVHVVVEHHDGAVLHGQSSEGALELVPIVDVAQRVGRVRWVEYHQARSRTPGSSPFALAVALPDEDPVRPGLEAGRVAKLRKVAPDVEQCLLRRILGEIDVAQDPVRDGEKPVAHGDRKERECLFVALLRPDTRLESITSAVWSPIGRALTRVWGAESRERCSFSRASVGDGHDVRVSPTVRGHVVTRGRRLGTCRPRHHPRRAPIEASGRP